ncbi:MAG TPA: hypothetical protein VF638_01040 [Sphingomonas sp.]
MKDADLRELVIKRRDASFKYVSSELSSARREALRFYRGDNMDLYGDSGDGLSTVVSRDTMEAIESMLPSLMKPFVAGDETVRFEPTGPEDEEPAKQATEYINYLFQNHNDAFRVIYDSLKDGLLYRYGCAKVVMEEVEDSAETYRSVTPEERMAAEAAGELEIVGDIEENDDGTFNLRAKPKAKRKMFRVHVIAPEQFIFEQRLSSLADATFLAHHDERVVGDLIAMGLPKAKVEKLQAGMPDTLEDDERHRYDSERENLDDADPARKVWVDECYIRCDYEGDGTLSWRKVVIAGNDNTLLLNEEADDHPFEGWTPIPEPHKLVGQSIADLTRDIQMQKTALKRETQNAAYLANRPMREAVEGQVNLDDLLNPTVGGVVRVKQVGMIRELPSGGANVIDQAMQLIESLDADREARTGVTRYNQGMDANSLNKTATGVSIISNASMQRQELVARQYAESFLKPVFLKMLGLVSRHQDKAQVIRLRGKWVEMDPSEWKTGYDMSVSVGLGTGNKDQVMAHLQALLAVQQQIAEGQGGPNGPLVTWENIYEVAKQLPATMGLKGNDRFFTDPAPDEGEQGGEQQPQQPDPAATQAQAAQQAQAQAEQEKHAAELAQKHDTAVEVANIDADAKVRIASIGAVKELVVAGLSVEEAGAIVESAPDVFAGATSDSEQGQQPVPMDAPEMAPEQALDVDPELLAAMVAQEQGMAPDDGSQPEMDMPL